MYNILICDDERDIVEALKIYLSCENYKIIEAYNGAEALAALERNDIHLVIMDIMMPKLDGITATVKLRTKSNVPVILLTAKSEDTDKVLGLDIGADDYITKPFNPVEVIARVKSQLRRYTQLGSRVMYGGTIKAGPIELDDAAKSVSVDGGLVALTPTEFCILKLLMENPGKVFSSKDIYNAVRDDFSPGVSSGAENAVAVHIRHLREKLEINPAEPRYLKVVWGQGYKIERENKS